MHIHRRTLLSPKLVKIIAAIIVGLSIGTAVPPEPILLPVVGAVPGLAVGTIGLLAGAALYLRGPTFVGSPESDCGCTGDCGCS